MERACLQKSPKRSMLGFGQRSYGRFSYAQYPSEKPVNPADFTKNQRLGVLSWAEMRHNKLYAQRNPRERISRQPGGKMAQQSPKPVQLSAAGQ